MKQDYLQNWTMMMNEMQKPFQEMLDLNFKTLHGLKYLTLEEMSSAQKPEELLDKQVKLMMKNSHMLLDYMGQSFQLLESAFLSLSKQLNENTEQSIKKSGAELLKNQKTVSKKIKKTVKSSVPKNTATKNKIAAPESALSSRKKTPSKSTTIQNRVKPELKAKESKRKQDVPSTKRAQPVSKKEKPTPKIVLPGSKGKPIISTEKQKDAPLSKAVSDKKEERLKIRMTKLERKMGMPEPKGILLNQMNLSDDSMSIPPIIENIENIISEHHTSPSDHPMAEQEGKGKNPFKK